MRTLGLALLVAIVICLGGIYMIRKDFPYDLEVVPRVDRIAIVNKTEWMNRDLAVKYQAGKGPESTFILPGNKKEGTISGLTPGMEYRLVIKRKDLPGLLKYRPLQLLVKTENRPYVVLVGASIGYAWDFPHLPNRLKNDQYLLGYRLGIDGFDKSSTLEKLVTSGEKPGGVIIKECATYFPRDLETGKKQIRKWVALLEERGVVPILATIVPVTKENDAKNIGRQTSINHLNEFIRKFALEKGLTVLDLQKALEDGSNNHYLKTEYAALDGLHLNKTAYSKALDPIVFPALSAIFPKQTGKH